jgi:exopolysaccharide production protein ExoZ
VVAGFTVLLTESLGVGLSPQFLQTLLRSALPAAAIILGMLALEEHDLLPTSPLLHAMGDASYSLYLTHIFTLGMVRYAWGRLGLDHEGVPYAIGYALVGLLFVALVAWWTHRFVENPILQVLHRVSRQLRTRKAVPAS